MKLNRALFQRGLRQFGRSIGAYKIILGYRKKHYWAAGKIYGATRWLRSSLMIWKKILRALLVFVQNLRYVSFTLNIKTTQFSNLLENCLGDIISNLFSSQNKKKERTIWKRQLKWVERNVLLNQIKACVSNEPKTEATQFWFNEWAEWFSETRYWAVGTCLIEKIKRFMLELQGFSL